MAVWLWRPIAALAIVARESFANGRLGESDGLRNLALVRSYLLHIADDPTVLRTEGVAFVTHS